MALSFSEKLGYAGLVPFVAGAVAILFGVEGAEEMFKLYSVLILSFLAGGCWGIEQAHPEQINEIPVELSVGVFVWGILAYFLPINVSVIMTSVGFWLLLWTESNPIFKDTYTKSHKRMRNVLTTVVTVLHVIVFIAVN